MEEKLLKEKYALSLSTFLPVPLFDSAMTLNVFGMGAHAAGYNKIAATSQMSADLLFLLWLASSTPYFATTMSLKNLDFQKHFGADVKTLERQSLDGRLDEIEALTEKLNDEYVPQNYEKKELARLVNRELENYLESITGEAVRTSSRIRKHGFFQVLFPFALGACSPIDGEIYIFKDTGVFEPHLITHELAHRHGYGKELHAQALAYLALMNSKNPVFMQSANCERLNRQIMVVNDCDRKQARFFTERSDLRAELRKDFLKLMRRRGIYEGVVSLAILPLYQLRMKLTGQNGLQDYAEGFTNFLYTTGNKINP